MANQSNSARGDSPVNTARSTTPLRTAVGEDDVLNERRASRHLDAVMAELERRGELRLLAQLQGPLQLVSHRTASVTAEGTVKLDEVVDVYGQGLRSAGVENPTVPVRVHRDEGTSPGDLRVTVSNGRNLIRIEMQAEIPISANDDVNWTQFRQFASAPNVAPLQMAFGKTADETAVMDIDPTHFGLQGILNIGLLVQATRAEDGRIRIREAIEIRANDGNERPSHELHQTSTRNPRETGALAEFRERIFAGVEVLRVDRDVRLPAVGPVPVLKEIRYYAPPSHLQPGLLTARSNSQTSSVRSSLCPTARSPSLRTGVSRDSFSNCSIYTNSLKTGRSLSSNSATADTSAGHSASRRSKTAIGKSPAGLSSSLRTARPRTPKHTTNSAPNTNTRTARLDTSARSVGVVTEKSTKGHRSLSHSPATALAQSARSRSSGYSKPSVTAVSGPFSRSVSRSSNWSEDSSPTAKSFHTTFNTARANSAPSSAVTAVTPGLRPAYTSGSVTARSGSFNNISSMSEDSAPTALSYRTPIQTVLPNSNSLPSMRTGRSRSRSVSQDSAPTALSYRTPIQTAKANSDFSTRTARSMRTAKASTNPSAPNTARSLSPASSTKTALSWSPKTRLSAVQSAYAKQNTSTPARSLKTANSATPGSATSSAKSQKRRRSTADQRQLTPNLLHNVTNGPNITPNSNNSSRRRSGPLLAKIPPGAVPTALPVQSPHPNSSYLRTARVYSPYTIRQPQGGPRTGSATNENTPNRSTMTARSMQSPPQSAIKTAIRLPDTPRPLHTSTPRTNRTQNTQSPYSASQVGQSSVASGRRRSVPPVFDQSGSAPRSAKIKKSPYQKQTPVPSMGNPSETSVEMATARELRPNQITDRSLSRSQSRSQSKKRDRSAGSRARKPSKKPQSRQTPNSVTNSNEAGRRTQHISPVPRASLQDLKNGTLFGRSTAAPQQRPTSGARDSRDQSPNMPTAKEASREAIAIGKSVNQNINAHIIKEQKGRRNNLDNSTSRSRKQKLQDMSRSTSRKSVKSTRKRQERSGVQPTDLTSPYFGKGISKPTSISVEGAESPSNRSLAEGSSGHPTAIEFRTESRDNSLERQKSSGLPTAQSFRTEYSSHLPTAREIRSGSSGVPTARSYRSNDVTMPSVTGVTAGTTTSRSRSASSSSMSTRKNRKAVVAPSTAPSSQLEFKTDTGDTIKVNLTVNVRTSEGIKARLRGDASNTGLQPVAVSVNGRQLWNKQ